ncbi:MAG: EscU/YscU/HrcU family type III secretion system export apparatus switch protein [Planctomycetota bacterium]
MTDKIHPASPRQRKRAREQGRVAKSKTVVTAGILLAVTALLSWWGEHLGRGLMTMVERSFQEPILTLDRGEAFRVIAHAVFAAAMLTSPILIALVLVAIGFNLLQTGLLFTPSKLTPTPERLNPTARLLEMVSPRSIGETTITALKLFAIFATAGALVRSNLPQIGELGAMPMGPLASSLFNLVLRCCGWIGLTVLALAILDYAIAWWQVEQSLRMTEQEFREEMRDLEGGAARYARSHAVTKV